MKNIVCNKVNDCLSCYRPIKIENWKLKIENLWCALCALFKFISVGNTIIFNYPLSIVNWRVSAINSNLCYRSVSVKYMFFPLLARFCFCGINCPIKPWAMPKSLKYWPGGNMLCLTAYRTMETAAMRNRAAVCRFTLKKSPIAVGIRIVLKI